MERGCATHRWANAAERGARNAEPGARGGDQPRRRRPGAQHPRPIGAERVARGDAAGSLGQQHPAEPPARWQCALAAPQPPARRTPAHDWEALAS